MNDPLRPAFVCNNWLANKIEAMVSLISFVNNPVTFNLLY